MNIPERVLEATQAHPHSLVFATLSGAHLYGFPSGDSDWDLRGAHVLPARDVLGLGDLRETEEVDQKEPGFELDLVTHDVAKFFRLMLKKNGYVLEQLYSPLVVARSRWFDELRELGRGCITKHHVHHYLGFARNQWDLFRKEAPPRVKPLLYTYRVLLTGIHLMQTGEVEANLRTLAETIPVVGLEDLVCCKIEGTERQTIPEASAEQHEGTVHALLETLEHEGRESALPELPRSREALSDLLVRIRLEGLG